VSELRSVIVSLRGEVLSELPDARVEEDFSELHAAVEALEAERLRRLAEIERRRIFERDGHVSAASWLAGRFGLGWGEARRGVALARGLERMVRVRRALEAGAVSLSAVGELAEVQEAEPEAFVGAEGFLVDAAARLSITDLRRAARHWRTVMERERAGPDGLAEVLRARRRLHASVTLEGTVRLDGDLDPETGETVLTALGAVLDTEARSTAGTSTAGTSTAGADRDDRTSAQRRADALGEICLSWLDRSDRPEVAGERPHLSVTVPLDALRAPEEPGLVDRAPGVPSVAELDHVGPVDRATVRRLAAMPP